MKNLMKGKSAQSCYLHEKALVESDKIGKETRIWAFVHVLKGAEIGSDCNIGDHSFIEGGVKIGDEVIIKNGVSIWKGVTIEDRVFIGPNASFTNDHVPRAKVYHETYEKTLIRKGASIGSNATIVAPRVVGRYAVVGAGAVVTADVPDYGMVCGNPAQLKGWVCKCGKRLDLPVEGDGKAACGCGLQYTKNGPQITQYHLPELPQ